MREKKQAWKLLGMIVAALLTAAVAKQYGTLGTGTELALSQNELRASRTGDKLARPPESRYRRREAPGEVMSRSAEERTSSIVSVVGGPFDRPVVNSTLVSQDPRVVVRRVDGGVFELSTVNEQMNRVDLEIYSPGYNFTSIPVDLTNGESTVVKLVASAVSYITIKRDGATVGENNLGTEVIVGSDGLPPVSLSPFAPGRYSIAHTESLNLQVRENQRGTIANRTIEPGDHVSIELDSIARIRLVDEHQRPIPGASVRLIQRTGRGELTNEFATNEGGEIFLSSRFEGELAIKLLSPDLRFSPKATSRALSSNGRRELTFQLASLPSIVLEVGLIRSVKRLTVLDAVDGSMITGDAFLVRREDDPRMGILEIVMGQFALNEGELRVPTGFSTEQPLGTSTVDLLFVPGYRPFEIPRGIGLFCEAETTLPPTLRIDPVDSPCYLELYDGNTPVSIGAVAAKDPISGLFCYVGGGRRAGQYGPLECREELSVCDLNGVPIGVARRRRPSQGIQLQLQDGLGEVCVLFKDKVSPSVGCLDVSKKKILHANGGDQRSLSFKNLQGGHYIVAPEPVLEELLAANAGTLLDYAIQVREGEVVELHAQEWWSGTEELVGSIERRDRRSLYVVPLYRLPIVGFSSTLAMRRVRVTPEGDYRIGAIPSGVLALAVVDFFGEHPRVRDIVAPGDECFLDEKKLELICSDGKFDNRQLTVHYTYQGTVLGRGAYSSDIKTFFPLSLRQEGVSEMIPAAASEVGLYDISSGEWRIVPTPGYNDVRIDLSDVF